MAITRQRSKPRNRRNPSRASSAAMARPQRCERLSYTEYSSDEDDFLDAPSPPTYENSSVGNAAAAPRRSSRIANEHGTSTHTTQTSSVINRTEAGDSRPKSRNHTVSRTVRNGGQKRKRASRLQTAKRRKPATSRTPSKPDHSLIAKIPDWRDPRVSFDCWVEIFLHAARDGSIEVRSTRWLLHAAITCKAFTEPALTALYRCPTIKSSAKAKRLAALLHRPQSETLFNYRAKIETLQINTQIVPLGVLSQLIHPLTRLEELIIFTGLDQPPYRYLDQIIRWHYPEDVFTALEADQATSTTNDKPFPTVLKSWEWSGRFLGGFVEDIDAIVSIHRSTPFSQLTRLSLINFQVPSLKKLRITSEETEQQVYLEDGVVIESVANAISQLRALKHLVFESSTVMNDRLLPLLPKNLLHLELINCWEVRSEDLAAFLRTHGSGMQTLSLMHNQSLDLAFLTELNETCPKLRELRMNLSYYRHHDCVNDADPMYEQALLPSQIPQWPSSLRVLSIENIREWSVEAAEMFLQSIIDSAPDLPDLRHLAIKTMIDIPWQARAILRYTWRNKMEHVFLRPFVPPACFTALRQTVSEEKQTQGLGVSPSRRSSRLASNVELLASHAELDLTRATHQQQHNRPSYKEPETDDDEFDSGIEHDDVDEDDDDVDEDGDDVDDDVDEDDDDERDQTSDDRNRNESHHGRESSTTNDSPKNNSRTATPAFIHGKCTTVSVLFDNQKIRELQYSMEDFGTDDSDSEEEWNGDYEDDGANFVVF
ncbi:hypothetical protein E4U35_001208 [Claviceps purpurea]|nr:hypothetical protein E4U35_001208 [Claviceps purpurea]KAG6244038.1 hypothetical protein E4U23_006365 [Claviceps purpurea]